MPLDVIQTFEGDIVFVRIPPVVIFIGKKGSNSSSFSLCHILQQTEGGRGEGGEKEGGREGLTVLASLQPNGGLVAQLPVQLTLVSD